MNTVITFIAAAVGWQLGMRGRSGLLETMIAAGVLTLIAKLLIAVFA